MPDIRRCLYSLLLMTALTLRIGCFILPVSWSNTAFSWYNHIQRAFLFLWPPLLFFYDLHVLYFFVFTQMMLPPRLYFFLELKKVFTCWKISFIIWIFQIWITKLTLSPLWYQPVGLCTPCSRGGRNIL